jgi:hypothetical protein
MKRALLILLAVSVGGGGCGPYAGIQADLAVQSREGLKRVEAARAAEAELVSKWLAERRERLDSAFDADVRGQASLDPAWVIEARRAYATGLDSLASARADHERASAIGADNARAADEALALLEKMLRRQESVLKVELK